LLAIDFYPISSSIASYLTNIGVSYETICLNTLKKELNFHGMSFLSQFRFIFIDDNIDLLLQTIGILS